MKMATAIADVMRRRAIKHLGGYLDDEVKTLMRAREKQLVETIGQVANLNKVVDGLRQNNTSLMKSNQDLLAANAELMKTIKMLTKRLDDHETSLSHALAMGETYVFGYRFALDPKAGQQDFRT